MNLKVYMIRHGETYFNVYRKVQGWSDTPLTPKGYQEADESADFLMNIDFADAYCSDMQRCIETSKEIIERNPSLDTHALKLLPQFREQNFGYFEGMDKQILELLVTQKSGTKTMSELLNKYSFDYLLGLIHELDPFGNAETSAEYWQRIDGGFHYLYDQHPEGNVLLVTHSYTITSIVDKYSDIDAFNAIPQNGSVTRLSITPKNITVDYYDHHEKDFKY